LPNLINTIIVTSSLEVARMIIQESFLSFLGLGVQPPTPSWGGMLGEGRTYMLTHPWLATFPGIAIFVHSSTSDGSGCRSTNDRFAPR
jgi:peptide/nickel transport system permease protein